MAGAAVASDKPILFLWIVFFVRVCDDCVRERHVCVVFGRLEEKTHNTLGIFWESSMLAFLGGGVDHGNCCKQQQCSTDAPHCAIRKRYAAIILPLSTNKNAI